jgi:hypothetical protein
MRFHSIPWSGWGRAWCALAAAAVLGFGSVQAQVTGAADLNNFDIRYPDTGPNDLDVLVYVDDDVDCDDVIWTFNTGNQPSPGPGIGLIGWGQAQCINEGINLNPNSPGFGLRCIRIRWAGPRRPDMIGKCVHFGVHFRPGIDIKHQEITWTLDGQPIGQRCDPHIRWVWHHRTRTWVICIANPTDRPIYVWGCRWFLPRPDLQTALQVELPNLNQLNVLMDPREFGDDGWRPMPDIVPGQVPFPRVTCIPPWCRVYVRIRIPIVVCRPIVFQVAATGTDPVDPPQFVEPCDPRADMVLTIRPTEQFIDPDGDGGLGPRDLGPIRAQFGLVSQDLEPPQDDPLPTAVLSQPVGVPALDGRRR